jgi:two-component system, cell cycle response regulator DivK
MMQEHKPQSMDAKKILIIDDDNRNVFALSAVLQAKGFECLKALGMEEAFNILTKNDVDIILLDMMMPDIDGYQAMPLIRAREKNRDTPIIAVTAQAMKGDRERCIEAGADGYISKPVNIDELLSLMSTFIK